MDYRTWKEIESWALALAVGAMVFALLFVLHDLIFSLV
jgi:hypothetical protein